MKKRKAGRPRKNEINERVSLIITTKKLSNNIANEISETGLDKITIINKRLTQSYEER